MKLLAGEMLKAARAANDRLPLKPVIGGRIATFGDGIRKLVDLALIFHIAGNRGVVINKEKHHHERPYDEDREMGTATYPEVSFLYSLTHLSGVFNVMSTKLVIICHSTIITPPIFSKFNDNPSPLACSDGERRHEIMADRQKLYIF